MSDKKFSFFTDERLAAINTMNHSEATDYITTELENEPKDIRPHNYEKIVKMVENSRTHKRLLEGAYNFRLSAIGLKYI